MIHLERGHALDAGVYEQVTLPGHGQVEDGERQRAFTRRPKTTHVLTAPHRVDDHRAILETHIQKHTLISLYLYNDNKGFYSIHNIKLT